MDKLGPYLLGPNDENQGIYTGDAIELLREIPAGSVDLFITDPPYCSGGYLEAQKNTPAQGLRGATVAAEGFEWFSSDNLSTGGLLWLLRLALVECRRILRPGRSALIFVDWRMVPHAAHYLESAGMRYRNMIIWDKGNSGLGVGFRPRYEVVLEYTNGVTEYAVNNGENLICSKRVPSAQRIHNAQKPINLFMELMRVTTQEGAVIVDSFSGSGTAAVAATYLGRRYLAFELDPNTAGRGRKRVRETQPPLRMPQPEQIEFAV